MDFFNHQKRRMDKETAESFYACAETSYLKRCLLFLFFFFFPTAAPAAYGVPKPGIKLELQLQPTLQSQQHWIQATSATYTVVCSNTKSLTH